MLLLPALHILKNTPGLGNSYSLKNSGNVTIVKGGKYLIYCVAPPQRPTGQEALSGCERSQRQGSQTICDFE